MSEENQVLLVERRGHVVILTLNRPDVLNALDADLTMALYDVLDEIEGRFPEERVVVITANGRGFCSGADVSRMAASVQGRGATVRRTRPIVELAPRLREIPQPIVCAVNGVAAGAGLAIALASDVRIGSTQARFASIFIKRALVPDTATTYTLPRLVGPGVAAEMALTGRVVDAEFARSVGLVNRIVEPEQLLDEAVAIATEIAANPPVTIKDTKRLLDGVEPDHYMQVVQRERQTNDAGWETHDRKEAILAFVEKRAAVFTGD
jgi:enoyl-CoA hydratase/carnithine racemase